MTPRSENPIIQAIAHVPKIISWGTKAVGAVVFGVALAHHTWNITDWLRHQSGEYPKAPTSAACEQYTMKALLPQAYRAYSSSLYQSGEFTPHELELLSSEVLVSEYGTTMNYLGDFDYEIGLREGLEKESNLFKWLKETRAAGIDNRLEVYIFNSSALSAKEFRSNLPESVLLEESVQDTITQLESMEIERINSYHRDHPATMTEEEWEKGKAEALDCLTVDFYNNAFYADSYAEYVAARNVIERMYAQGRRDPSNEELVTDATIGSQLYGLYSTLSSFDPRSKNPQIIRLYIAGNIRSGFPNGLNTVDTSSVWFWPALLTGSEQPEVDPDKDDGYESQYNMPSWPTADWDEPQMYTVGNTFLHEAEHFDLHTQWSHPWVNQSVIRHYNRAYEQAQLGDNERYFLAFCRKYADEYAKSCKIQ